MLVHSESGSFSPIDVCIFFIVGQRSCSTVGFMPLGVRPLGFWHGYLDLLWLESLVWGLLGFDRLGLEALHFDFFELEPLGLDL